MDARTYTSCADLPARRWDAVAPPDFFFRREFLGVMEDSSVEEARYRYVVLEAKGETVGLAVLSAFTLRLDLLAGSPWLQMLRRVSPGLLDVPMVCCGVPASFGQHHLHVTRPELREAALRQVDRCMERWAGELGYGLLLWKEWSPDQGLGASARAAGYHVLPTLPDHVVRPLPPDESTFVAGMRSAYRRKYRKAVRLLDGEGPLWESGAFLLQESPFTPADVPDFHRGYASVLRRAPVRLETYPVAWFEKLARSGLDVRLLTLKNRGQDEALSALLIPSGERALNFALVAKERARYRNALYTTLLQCIVLLGIRRGVAEVRLGQTSTYAKCSVGARPRRLETFLRFRGALAHRVMERLGPRFFPEPEPARLRVFRDPSPHSTSLRHA